MAKTKARREKAEPARRAAHHDDGELWTRRLVVGGVAGVLILAAALVAFGWWWTQIRPLGKVVLRVENTEYSVSHLQRRVNLLVEETPSILQILTPGQIVDFTYTELEQEAKTLEGARELGVSVTDQEVDTEISRRGNLAEGAEGSVFARELRRQIDDSGLKESEYLQMIRADLLETKVTEHFAAEAPESGPHVRARWLIFSVDDGELAQEVLDRLRAGEDFEAVDAEISSAVANEVDWTYRIATQFPNDDVEAFLFETAEPNDYSDVITTGTNIYIAQLLERDEAKELDEDQRTLYGSDRLRNWRDELESRLEIERSITDEDRVRALDDII